MKTKDQVDTVEETHSEGARGWEQLMSIITDNLYNSHPLCNALPFIVQNNDKYFEHRDHESQ